MLASRNLQQVLKTFDIVVKLQEREDKIFSSEMCLHSPKLLLKISRNTNAGNTDQNKH